MKSKEDVVQGGLANFPSTLNKLFSGENFGKLVLQVAERCALPQAVETA